MVGSRGALVGLLISSCRRSRVNAALGPMRAETNLTPPSRESIGFAPYSPMLPSDCPRGEEPERRPGQA
jgi:hypothetical protein